VGFCSPIPREIIARFSRLPRQPGWHCFFAIVYDNQILNQQNTIFMTSSKNNRQQQDNPRSNKTDQSGKKSQSPGKNSQRPDEDEEPVTESGSGIGADNNTQIGDDPEQTKRKIPQMRR
jgi:hypothetical protein